MITHPRQLNVLIVQMSVSSSLEKNIKSISTLLQKNIDKKSKPIDLIVLPEMWTDLKNSPPYVTIDSIFNHPVGDFLKKITLKYQCFLVAGSLREAQPNTQPYNTTFVFNPSFQIVCIYRKIHLFSIRSSLHFDEKNLYSPGSTPAFFQIKDWKLGLATCFDIRFPELYRLYSQKGCHAVISCSAFTHQTGQKHWFPLLQARSIENRFFTINSNQCQTSGDGIKRFGHSCVISPDGTILSTPSPPDQPQTFFYSLSMSQIEQDRQTLESPQTHFFD